MIHRILFDLRYVFRPPWDTGISPPELIDYLANHAPGRAIDLGCGTGTNVLTLSRHGWKATGVDYSALAILRAHRRLRSAHVSARLLLADLSRQAKLGGPYDFALDIGCFHSIRDRRVYMANLAPILVAGAHLLLYGFLKPAEGDLGIGSGDLDRFSAAGIRLSHRDDGVDPGGRRSTWFLFEKMLEPVSAGAPHS